MKTSHYLILASVGLLGNLTADTIVLKTGAKYEGKVISEDEKSYLVEVRVTKSIKDERRIPKDHVVEIIKEAKDLQEFDKIKALIPTPDRLPLAAYSQRIEAAQSFLSKFPKTTHKKEVEVIIKSLQTEHKAIAAGGIKLSGQVISASDVDANAYDIHARMLYLDIKKYASNGQNQQALRKWETLQSDYAKSTAARDSLKIVGRILTAHIAELNNSIDTLEARETQRKRALESLDQKDRERTARVLAEKKKAYEELVEKEEKEMHTKWLTIDTFHRKALEYNLRNSESALGSLSSRQAAKVDLAGPSFRGAWSALAKGDLADAAVHIKKLQGMQLPAKYTEPLAKQLAEKKEIKAEEEKAAKEWAEQEFLRKVKEEEAAKAAKEAVEKKKPGRKGRKSK